MATVIAISNQKGGVGKTTTSIHLAAALALASQRVLLIDLDSQANATTGLGVTEADEAHPGSYNALSGDTPATADWARPSVMKGLSVLPASLDLAGIDLELGYKPDGPERLGRSIKVLRENFDWIIMDCPPSLGMLSVNALLAADYVITPLPPERFAIDGLERLQDTMWRLREAGRLSAPDPMILMTRVQAWSDSHRKRMISLRNDFGRRVLISEVPMAPGLEDAADQRRPIFMDLSESSGGDAYLQATAELMLVTQGTELTTNTVMALVAQMKAEIVRRNPKAERQVEAPVAAPAPATMSWLTRARMALRYGRHRRYYMLGGAAVVLLVLYAIGMLAF